MRLFIRAASYAALILILACAAIAQVTFTEKTGPDLPGVLRQAQDGLRQAQDAPRLIAGPCVQNVSASSATLIWQTNVPSRAEVGVSDGGSAQTFQTTASRRLAEVRIGRLAPDTVYKYSISLGSGPAVKGTFKTFPLAIRPVRFIVYGDTRTNPSRHREVIDSMAKEGDIDFVLHTGDVVSDGRKLESWIPEYLDPARKLICNLPVFAVLGNHEHNSPNYFSFFSLPGNERWYSFDLADVHVIGLDSNMSFDIGSEQYKWLVRDLAGHKSARWKFVFMHHPTYTSGPHGATSEDGVPRETPTRVAQELLPRLAAQFGITAIFAGHDHDYERSVRDGVSYIVTGGGGALTYGDMNSRHNPYRKVFYSGLHYCVVTIDGSRARMIVKTPSGKVIDKTEL